MFFTIENSKDPVAGTTEEPGGIGLENVRKRLKLLYPNNYKLDIVNAENSFRVDLKIKIQEKV